jgi:hypothetical protein
MTIETDINHGARAKEILENEVYIATFEAIKQEILASWQISSLRDFEEQKELKLMLVMLNKVQSTLQTVLETGNLAKINLKHQRTMLERLREFTGL